MESSVDPIVSICCLTYNHVNFIKDALDGFLMQKTNFPFEVLVHDDASTDGTSEIVLEYAKKYPDIIKPIIQKENQYSKGVKVTITYQFPRAKGKYIAICEGDDYWIDPYKLQKQLDFLEDHKDYSLVHSKAIIQNQNTKKVRTSRSWFCEQTKDHNDYISNFINSDSLVTASVLFRSEYLSSIYEGLNLIPFKLKMGDLPIFIILSSKGYIGYQSDEMVLYRIRDDSASDRLSCDQRINFILNAFKIKEWFLCYYSIEYSRKEAFKKCLLSIIYELRFYNSFSKYFSYIKMLFQISSQSIFSFKILAVFMFIFINKLSKTEHKL